MGRRGWNPLGMKWVDVIHFCEQQVSQGHPPLVLVTPLEVGPSLDMLCYLGGNCVKGGMDIAWLGD